MAKNTIILFVFLGLIATLLVGINVGKKISPEVTSPVAYNSPTRTPSITQIVASPTLKLQPTIATESTQIRGLTSYQHIPCKLSFSYPAEFEKKPSQSPDGVIFVDPRDSTRLLAVACAKEIPNPPVSTAMIEPITIASRSALLFHDTDPQGNPRDEVILKHPAGSSIILAAPPSILSSILPSVKLLK